VVTLIATVHHYLYMCSLILC